MNNGPILIIAGTNRPDSNALKVARAIERHYLALQVPAEVLSLIDLPIEMFDPAAYATKPHGVQALQQRVLDARGLHVITPEYNGSCPGVLKYFIDMLKFPESFQDKPVAFVGEANGQWGGLRAVEHLQGVFGYRNAYCFPQRVFIAGVKNKFDADDRIRDPELDARLLKQAQDFARFVSALRG
jgi:NAD(P)H-dependent FMN reductase